MSRNRRPQPPCRRLLAHKSRRRPLNRLKGLWRRRFPRQNLNRKWLSARPGRIMSGWAVIGTGMASHGAGFPEDGRCRRGTAPSG
jgi:hypothetical protein